MLGGAVEVERTAAFEPLIKTPLDDDFPAAALDSKGNEHIAWIRFVPARPGEARPMNFRTAPDDLSFLTAPPGGDQVRLRTIPTGGGTPKSPIPITEPGRDVYKVAVAVDAQDRVWVFWSERNEGQFDVWARPVVDGKASDPVRISQAPGNDVSPVATTDAAGRVWVAWQGVREGVFRILARRQLRDGDFGEETVVSTSDRSSWAPAIAASRRTEADPGRVAIVWDGYDKGDYDVWLRELDLEGRPSAPKAVANGPEYEARATAAYDHEGRLWISWEWSGPTWGKDYGTLDYADGIPLLKDRRIGLIVLAPDGTWLEPEESVEKVMPRGRFCASLSTTSRVSRSTAQDARGCCFGAVPSTCPRPSVRRGSNGPRTTRAGTGRVRSSCRTATTCSTACPPSFRRRTEGSVSSGRATTGSGASRGRRRKRRSGSTSLSR